MIKHFGLRIGANVDNQPGERGGPVTGRMMRHHDRLVQHNARRYSNQYRVGHKGVIEDREVTRRLAAHRPQKIGSLLSSRERTHVDTGCIELIGRLDRDDPPVDGMNRSARIELEIRRRSGTGLR